MPSSPPQTIAVIPTYNEHLNLEPLLNRVRAVVPGIHILVVDDNSPDGTGQLADSMASTDPHIHVLHRTAKDGLGAAYRAGFRWALDHGYDVVVQMDADGSHLPEQLPALLSGLRDADLSIGSRWVPGGSTVGWPAHRQLLSKAGSWYARHLLHLAQSDVTGGFRAFRASTLEATNFGTVTSRGYCFQIEMLWRAVRNGAQVVEVPITFHERVHGASKMSGAIVFEAWANVTRWGLAGSRA